MFTDDAEILTQLEQEAFSESFGSEWVVASGPTGEEEDSSQDNGEGATPSLIVPTRDPDEEVSQDLVVPSAGEDAGPSFVHSSSAKSTSLTREEYERSLQDSMNRAMKRPRVNFPWDEGPLVSIFGQEDVFPKFFTPHDFQEQAPDLAPGQAIAMHIPEEIPSQKTALQCVRARPDLSFPESEEALKLKAIMTWTEMLANAPHQFQVGRDVLQQSSQDPGNLAPYPAETVEAVMGVKAPSTVLSRRMAVK